MKTTLTPQYHEVTLHPTLEGLEVHCENASGDVWVIAFDSAIFGMLSCMILASYGIVEPVEDCELAGEQEEIPF